MGLHNLPDVNAGQKVGDAQICSVADEPAFVHELTPLVDRWKIVDCGDRDYSCCPWTMIVEQRVGGYKHSGDIAAFPIREYRTDLGLYSPGGGINIPEIEIQISRRIRQQGFLTREIRTPFSEE